MSRSRSVDDCTPDPVDLTTATDQDEDTIMVVIPSEPATPTKNPRDKANNDLKASAQDTMDVDKEVETTKDVDMNEGDDGTGGSIEPAVNEVGGGDGQDGTGENTEPTTEGVVRTSKGSEET